MLGHEISHLAIARFTEEEARPIENTPLLQNKQYLQYREEHECDWMGHVLSTHALAEVYQWLPLPAWHIFAHLSGPIFLAFLQLTDRASHMVRTGTDLKEDVPIFGEGVTEPEGTSTHPPVAIRKWYLLDSILKRAPLEAREDMAQVFQVGEWISSYLESSWTFMRGFFRQSQIVTF